MTGQGEEEILARLTELQRSLVRIQERVARLESGNRRSGVEDLLSQEPFHARSEKSADDLDLNRINEAMRKLVTAKSQEEILEVYLREAHVYVSRAILFLNKDEQYVPWEGIGFSSERMESLTAEHPDDLIVRAARQKKIICRGDALEESLPWLKEVGPLPGVLICIPLIFEDSVPVVFYGDTSEPISIDSLELLTHLTVLVLKNHYLQYRMSHQAPQVDEDRFEGFHEVISKMASVAPTQFQEQVGTPVSPQQEVKTESPPASHQQAPIEMESSRPEVGSGVQEEAQGESLGGMLDKMDSSSPAQYQAEEPTGPGVEERKTESAPVSVEQNLQAPEADRQEPETRAEERKRRHDEAWRYARLLVNEIKLLHEEDVVIGRQGKDLYRRLKRDVERSREMYERYVDPKIAFDYFHREVVRILASGDETLLGADYPGPSTEK